jgi:hypothetical protein
MRNYEKLLQFFASKANIKDGIHTNPHTMD